MHRVPTFCHRALPILPFFLSVVQIIFPANSLHIANLSGLPSIRSSTLLNGDAGNESISLARENGKRSTNREINPSAIPRQISSPSSKEREEESNTLREARENSSSIRSGLAVRDLGWRRRSGSRDVCWSVVQTLHRSPSVPLSSHGSA